MEQLGTRLESSPTPIRATSFRSVLATPLRFAEITCGDSGKPEHLLGGLEPSPFRFSIGNWVTRGTVRKILISSLREGKSDLGQKTNNRANYDLKSILLYLYQPAVPVPPLNGPSISEVIQPP
jgi:hypothetical protein